MLTDLLIWTKCVDDFNRRFNVFYNVDIHVGVIKKEDTWFAKQYTTNTLHTYEEDTPHPHTLPQNQQTLQK